MGWRNPWPPHVTQLRDDQVAAQADWATYGSGDDGYAYAHGHIHQVGTMTVVNPLDPVASGLRETPPGHLRAHGMRPIPAGRP